MFAKLAHKDVPKELVELSMLATFGGTQSADFYRFDFMICFFDEEMQPQSFILCQEMSSEHVWLSYGGTVKDCRGPTTIKNFRESIADLSKSYKHIGAQVLNDNFPMLKIYVSHGFKIVGTRQNASGQIFVEFFKDVSKGDQNG